MTNYFVKFFQCMTLLGLMLGSASAALIVDIQDATIQAGGSGSIDILIRSTGTDQVAATNFLIEISTINQVGGELRFSASQSSSEQSDDRYLFFGDSSPDNFLSQRQDPDFQRLVQIDVAASFANNEVSSANQLLATIDLEHLTPTPLTSSGEFRIALIEDPNNTFFVDESFDTGNAAEIDSRSFDRTDNAAFGSGIVTVTAVPEPVGMSLALLMGSAYLYRKRRGKAYGKNGSSF